MHHPPVRLLVRNHFQVSADTMTVFFHEEHLLEQQRKQGALTGRGDRGLHSPCSQGLGPAPGVLSSPGALALSTLPLCRGLWRTSPWLLRPPEFLFFGFPPTRIATRPPCQQNPGPVQLVLHFLFLVPVGISGKSSAFCVCISLERSVSFIILSRLIKCISLLYFNRFKNFPCRVTMCFL